MRQKLTGARVKKPAESRLQPGLAAPQSRPICPTVSYDVAMMRRAIASYEFSFLMEPEPDLGISLIDAVRDQLGLKLEKKKGQADIVVVDQHFPIE